MSIKSNKELEEYLDKNLDVSGNPHDNIFLYKHFLRFYKDVEHRIVKNLYNCEYIGEYIKHMKLIGWHSPVELNELKNKYKVN